MASTRQSPDAPPQPGAPVAPAPAQAPTGERPLPERDMRARRPALGFLLRLDTARRFARVGSLLALDFAAIFGAILTALVLKAYLRDKWNFDRSLDEARHSFAFAYLVATLLFARSGLYAERAARPGLAVIVASLFQTMVVTVIFALVQGEQFSSYYIFYGTLFFAVAYVSTARYVYERVTGAALKAAGYQRRAVLVGSGKHIDAVAHALSDGPHPAVSVVGFISLVPRPDNGLRSLGRLEDLDEIVSEHRLDEVIIADYDFPQQEAVDLVARCHQKGVRVRVAPSTMEILIHRAEFVPGQTVPLFELKPPVFDGIDFAVKRAFDVTVATLLLLLLSPILIASAAIIKLTSRGPAIYRSIRPGIGGVPFACLKFRTMYRDADQQQVDLESLNEASGALFKIKDDPRMTPFGRALRRFSLDELPQLLNVLKGDMSLVGPRPLPQRDFEHLEEWHKKRYLVLPGITGLWQVSGRSDLDFDDLVRLDFLYLERWSVFLDLTILVKTVPAVFTRRGAF
ncbi:MAG: sugar transferase [Solirubrobacterales bacterium]|jgi:exopolysaccharide biosynthesis polyprenyl glycosylphosphotransferase|nr:sugar transferase [Solirubrobacterales bacterium]